MAHVIFSVEQAISALVLLTESRELMTTQERRALSKSISEWIVMREVECKDVAHGTAHLMLQSAHVIGELNRKISRLKEMGK